MKLFQDNNLARLQKSVNEWVMAQKGISDISYQLSTASMTETPGGAEYVVTTILVSYR